MGNYQEWRNGKDRLKKGYYAMEFLWKCRCLVVIILKESIRFRADKESSFIQKIKLL